MDWGFPAHTILLVQLFYLESVTSLQNNVPVELIPERPSRKFWTREFGERAEVHAVDAPTDEVNSEEEEP